MRRLDSGQETTVRVRVRQHVGAPTVAAPHGSKSARVRPSVKVRTNPAAGERMAKYGGFLGALEQDRKDAEELGRVNRGLPRAQERVTSGPNSGGVYRYVSPEAAKGAQKNARGATTAPSDLVAPPGSAYDLFHYIDVAATGGLVGDLRHGRLGSAGVNAAFLFPFLRGGRAVLVARNALKEGKTIGEAAAVGRESMREAGPISKEIHGTRTFRHEGLSREIPAAGSMIGRTVENVLDRHRDSLAKAGLMKTNAEKVGTETRRTTEFAAAVKTAPADALKKYARRLRGPQEYALRILSEHSLPGNPLSIGDRAQFHLDQIGGADKQSAIYHSVHADLIEKAKKYLVEGADGSITLAENAPKNLRESWRLLQDVASGREDIYRDLGRLTDKQIAERVNAPGRVFRGARWAANEQVITQILSENPVRQQLHAAIDATIGDEAERAAAKSAIDAAARRYAEVSGEDPVAAVDELFTHLTGATTDPPSGLDAALRSEGGDAEENARRASGDAARGEAAGDSGGGPGPGGGVHTPELAAAEHQRFLAAGAAADQLEQLRHTDVFGDVSREWGDLKGAVSFQDRQMLVHLVQGHADLSTAIHEWGHVLRRAALTESQEHKAAAWAGARPVYAGADTTVPGSRGKKEIVGYEWTVEAEEKFARGLEQWFREGNGPKGLKSTFRTASTFLREIYDQADLPDVSPQMRGVFERLFEFNAQKGGRLVGAEDFHFGVNYAAYVRGAPVSFKHPAAMTGAYIRKMTQLFGGGRHAAIGAGPDDELLHHAFTGVLIQSGMFKPDVTGAAVDNLTTAVRLSIAKMVRDSLLEAATPVPKRIDDIAIKVDPKQDNTDDVRALWDRLDSIDNGGELLSAADLEGIDFSLAEALRSDLFPGQIGGKDARNVAHEILTGVTDPLNNYVWASREVIDSTGVMYVPRSAKVNLRGMSKQQRLAKGTLDLTFTAFSDLQKALILYLHPMYIPVNLTGNLVMNAMQQGVFMPVNLWKAATLHRHLDVEHRVLIDKIMGHGLTGSLSLKTAPGQVLNKTIGHWSSIAVDLIPRRSAFLHEARREGIKTPEQLKALLTDESPEGLQRLQRIRDKAADAIVDYDRMTPWERETLARWIFVYPWLRGATRYSIRFAADHPIQTMALAMMMDHAVANADEDLGPRPYYAALEIPVSTKSVGLSMPGTDIGISADDFFGVHEMRRKDGKFYTVNPRQALTATTPFELVEAGIGTVGAPIARAAGADKLAKSFENMPTIAENIAPGFEALAVTISGYDPETHKEVPKDIGTLGKQFVGNISLINKIKAINDADPDNQRKLYPRSSGEAKMAAVLGGLAPKPFNSKVAAKIVAGHTGKTLEEKEQDSLRLMRNQLGSVPPEVEKALHTKTLYKDAQKVLKEENGTDGLSERELAKLKLRILRGAHPEYDETARTFAAELDQSDEPKLYAAIGRWAEKALGWDIASKYELYAKKLRDAKRRSKRNG
jgi:hypothetical protein